ncbi:hypothetical protein ACTXT7_017590 [Hymenolepis weldensis]
MIGGNVWANLTKFPTVMHAHEGLGVNADAGAGAGAGADGDGDAYVETLQTIVAKPPCIEEEGRQWRETLCPPTRFGSIS